MLRLLQLLLAACLLLTAASSPASRNAERWLQENRADNLHKLTEFVSIPSVSADTARAHHVREAADWLVKDLKESGLQHVQLLETELHPSVYAHWLGRPASPTVLIYGHYDVQPEDPVDLWTSAPFTPTVRDGKLFARGASDDKGHVYAPVLAVTAFLKTAGELPVNVKLLIEGEEEIGSPNVEALLVKHKRLLAADYSFSADGGQVSPTQPGLCLGLRGSVAMQIELVTANVDLHSGSFGGGIQNPLHALAQLISRLRDPVRGTVLVDGFYEAVDELTQDEKESIANYPESWEKQLERIGVQQPHGEHGYSFYERTWARPSLEVVGMWGGFQGIGLKTVLPKEAHAKLSMRLVNSQVPGVVIKQVEDYIHKEAAKIPGVTINVTHLPFSANPFKMAKNTPGNIAATRVLTELYGKDPVLFRMGGSIPVMSYLREHLGLETTMFAFGHSDENVHAPDEFARIDSLERAEIAYVRLLEEVAVEHQKGAASDAKVEL